MANNQSVRRHLDAFTRGRIIGKLEEGRSVTTKGRRQDLLELAETLDISIQDNFKILDIKDAILKSEGYDAEFTCECLNRIISDRKELELRAERDRENQRIFELQKLQLITDTSTTADSNMPKLELHKLLPIFDPKTTDVTIFLDLFERQLTFLKVPVPQWVVYLVGLLPTEVSNLITKESFADAQDYYKVKQILLKRFKLSAEKFRQMFSRHTKDPVKTWRDFYFDLQTYFDGWLKESKVTTLEELKDLIVVDQIIKKTPQDYKDHFLDQCCNWNNPLQLVDKLDSPWRSNYTQNPKLSYGHSLSGFPSQSRWKPGFPVTVGGIPFPKTEYLKRKSLIQKKTELMYLAMDVVLLESFDQDATLATQFDKKDNALSSSLNQSNFYSFSSESNPISIIQISICNTEAAVCADTGATHSVAGEKLYHLLKQKGLNFEEKTMQMTLADGRIQTIEILKTSVDISIQGKVIPTELLTLKNARVVLIPKPNGTFRLCIDYRKLNEITVADTYPLPRMDDLLHQAKLTPFMSTLDLRAGYHQVKVHVEDQDKTAFVCPFGTYRFLRKPYGLRNAPATFQRLMNRFVMLHFGKEADHEKLHPHHKIYKHVPSPSKQFPTEPSIPQQELLLQQLIMSPRRDVVGSIEGDCNPRSLNSSHMNSRKTIAPSSG
ncbi:hypothetical protein TNCV_4089671 [Trichonephila clavipes]|nr:hypothetical protein TNCV_4089671 [Trichonephila clavipes]